MTDPNESKITGEQPEYTPDAKDEACVPEETKIYPETGEGKNVPAEAAAADIAEKTEGRAADINAGNPAQNEDPACEKDASTTAPEAPVSEQIKKEPCVLSEPMKTAPPAKEKAAADVPTAEISPTKAQHNTTAEDIKGAFQNPPNKKPLSNEQVTGHTAALWKYIPIPKNEPD